MLQPKPYTGIYIKGTLVKAKAKNTDHVVTRNISCFHRIPKDAVFPSSRSEESDDEFEYTRH